MNKHTNRITVLFSDKELYNLKILQAYYSTVDNDAVSISDVIRKQINNSARNLIKSGRANIVRNHLQLNETLLNKKVVSQSEINESLKRFEEYKKNNKDKGS